MVHVWKWPFIVFIALTGLLAGLSLVVVLYRQYHLTEVERVQQSGPSGVPCKAQRTPHSSSSGCPSSGEANASSEASGTTQPSDTSPTYIGWTAMDFEKELLSRLQILPEPDLFLRLPYDFRDQEDAYVRYILKILHSSDAAVEGASSVLANDSVSLAKRQWFAKNCLGKMDSSAAWSKVGYHLLEERRPEVQNLLVDAIEQGQQWGREITRLIDIADFPLRIALLAVQPETDAKVESRLIHLLANGTRSDVRYLSALQYLFDQGKVRDEDRDSVYYGFASSGDPKATNLMIDLLAQGKVRGTAVMTVCFGLVHSGNPRAVDSMIDLALKSGQNSSMAADVVSVLGLGYFKPGQPSGYYERMRPLLVSALSDVEAARGGHGEYMLHVAMKVLSQEPALFPKFLELTYPPASELTRNQALECLRRFGQQGQAKDRLFEVATDPQEKPSIRESAALGFADIGSADEIRKLISEIEAEPKVGENRFLNLIVLNLEKRAAKLESQQK